MLAGVCRQPSVLLVTAPVMVGQLGVALCVELAAFSNSLSHLELTSATATWLSGLQGLHNLTCLSLRNCPNLTAAAIQAALQQLPQVGVPQNVRLCDTPGCREMLAALAGRMNTARRLAVCDGVFAQETCWILHYHISAADSSRDSVVPGFCS